MPETIAPPGTVPDKKTLHGLPSSRAQAQISRSPMQRIRDALKLTGEVPEHTVLREAADVLEGMRDLIGESLDNSEQPAVKRGPGRPPGSKNRSKTL